MHKFLKTASLFVGLAAFGATFATDNQNATVKNHTGKNIHIEYEICTENVCTGGGGVSLFTNESSHFNVKLKSDQVLVVKTAEEIDAENGNTIPFPVGAEGIFDHCKGKAGQTLGLWINSTSPRAKNVIWCQID